jgi:hypothetical protein
LACLSYELLAGTHPFQRRRATEARDFGIVPLRPAGLTRQQWQALTMGLSWHRARRSISVRTWLDKMRPGRAGGPLPAAENPESPPAHRSPAMFLRTGALLGVLLICVAAWVSLVGLVGRKFNSDDVVPPQAASAASKTAAAPLRETAALPPAPVAPDATPTTSESLNAQLHNSETPSPAASNMRSDGYRPKIDTANAAVVSASDYTVHTGERFAEIRVHRSPHGGSDTPFVWWTEAASAKPGIDYVHQGKAIQTFPKGKTSTSFFVKLVPTAPRKEPEVFYIAIAAAGHGASPGKVARAAVWLPTNPDQS